MLKLLAEMKNFFDSKYTDLVSTSYVFTKIKIEIDVHASDNFAHV